MEREGSDLVLSTQFPLKNEAEVEVVADVIEIPAQSESQHLQSLQQQGESYWTTKKEEFVGEMGRLLAQGVEMVNEGSVTEPLQEVLDLKVAEMKSALNDQTKSEQHIESEKRLIKECAMWIVEGKSGSEYDLIRLSTILKEYAETKLSLCDKSIEFYRDLIAENAEKKNYGLRFTKDISQALSRHFNVDTSALKIGLHEVWEVKEIQILSASSKLEDLDFLRKGRRHHIALLKSLEKLVKAIDKSKGEDEAFGNYQKTASNPPRMKIQQKLNNGNKKQQQAQQLDKAIEDNLKKMKLDTEEVAQQEDQIISDIPPKKKQSKKTQSAKKSQGKENKEENIQSESQNNILKEEQESQKTTIIENSKSSVQSHSQKRKQPSVQQVVQPPIPSGQKNILSFFKKPIGGIQDESSNHSQILNNQTQPQVQEQAPQDNQSILQTSTLQRNQIDQQQNGTSSIKSIFRRIGGADPRPTHLQTSDKTRNILDTKEVFEVIKQESYLQWGMLKESRLKKVQVSKNLKGGSKRRRILVSIHDYVRQFKNVIFDQRSRIIKPRNPLARDEELVQYDLDSEDELQELNAENIENEEEDVDEDEIEDDDSAKQFIVPDGYLSDEGLDSDREDIVDQKKLTFQNYTFTDNINKQGFIFQEKDKTIDVANFLSNFRARKFCESDTFPLALKKKETNTEEQPNGVHHIWNGERLKSYIRVVHGQFSPKKTLLEQIQKLDIMKDISKNRLEQKFREILQKDEKSEGCGGVRCWIVNQAVIDSLDFDENEILELKRARLEEYKSTRSSKKEEKTQILSQNVPPTLSPQLQQTLQPKLSSSLNIFSSAPPLKKDLNITIVSEVISRGSSQEREIVKEENKESTCQAPSNVNSQKEELVEIEESKNEDSLHKQDIENVFQNNEPSNHSKNKSKNFQTTLNNSSIEEEINGSSSKGKQSDRKNSSLGNQSENSNATGSKKSLKQSTLLFMIKKS